MRNIPELHVQPLLDWEREHGHAERPIPSGAECVGMLALAVAGWFLVGLLAYGFGQGIGALTLAVGW